MAVKTFKRELLLEILDAGTDGALLFDTIIGTTRWALQHAIIFHHEGKFWKTTYQVGATERQDESPWEYVPDVTCVEVEPFEKVVVDYRPVA